jgi:hypothetical protein
VRFECKLGVLERSCKRSVFTDQQGDYCITVDKA